MRWRNFDYSSARSYFVTFCTHERKNILSHIVGAIHESPAVELSGCGRVIDTAIKAIPDRFEVTVDHYVIMPNHIHLLLTIKSEESNPIASNIPRKNRSILSKIIGYTKMNASKEINKRFGFTDIWQRGFYDHVVRDSEEFQKIIKYIHENPLLWQMGITEDW